MKTSMQKLLTLAMVMGLFLTVGCSGKTDAVESGTYEGTIDEVEPSETEIYVKTGDGKTLELYFTDSTKLTKGGETVPFSDLKKDMPVEVTVEKEGKRLNPIAVKIMNKNE